MRLGTVPIASYVPLMMFAVLFGLSMDHEVFLVSRIEQHHERGQSPTDAITSGLGVAAHVVLLPYLDVEGAWTSGRARECRQPRRPSPRRRHRIPKDGRERTLGHPNDRRGSRPSDGLHSGQRGRQYAMASGDPITSPSDACRGHASRSVEMVCTWSEREEAPHCE